MTTATEIQVRTRRHFLNFLIDKSHVSKKKKTSLQSEAANCFFMLKVFLLSQTSQNKERHNLLQFRLHSMNFSHEGFLELIVVNVGVVKP